MSATMRSSKGTSVGRSWCRTRRKASSPCLFERKCSKTGWLRCRTARVGHLVGSGRSDAGTRTQCETVRRAGRRHSTVRRAESGSPAAWPHDDPGKLTRVGKRFADLARIIGIGGHISTFPQPTGVERHRRFTAVGSRVLGRRSSFPCLIAAASQKACYRHILIQCFPVQPATAQFDRFSLHRSCVQKPREPRERDADSAAVIERDPHAILVEAHGFRRNAHAKLVPSHLGVAPPVAEFG